MAVTEEANSAQRTCDVAVKHMLFISPGLTKQITDPCHKKKPLFCKAAHNGVSRKPITFSVHYFKLNDSEKKAAVGKNLVRHACPRHAAG